MGDVSLAGWSQVCGNLMTTTVPEMTMSAGMPNGATNPRSLRNQTLAAKEWLWAGGEIN